MNSTFMGLEISKRGMMAHQQALHVTATIGQCRNKEYSRQGWCLPSSDPLYVPALNRSTGGQSRSGSAVSQVERVLTHY
jgi:flagellar hook-associated protein FlgK